MEKVILIFTSYFLYVYFVALFRKDYQQTIVEDHICCLVSVMSMCRSMASDC